MMTPEILRNVLNEIPLWTELTNKNTLVLLLIVATNKAEQLDLSLLRSERFGIKLLITYPEKDELKDIIKVNLNLFYDDMKAADPSFLGNKSKGTFVKEFTDFMFKEISENKEY